MLVMIIAVFTLLIVIRCEDNKNLQGIRQNEDKQNLNAENISTKKYDIIVVGGEPEGIAAAVSSARNGMKTLLIEQGNALGGLMTLGRLNFLDMNYDPDKNLLTRGIFKEFYDELGNGFDIEEAKKYFYNLVTKEENISLKVNIDFLEPLMKDDVVIGVRVNENGEIIDYYGARIIDATVDADVAAATGVPYTIGAADYGKKGELMGVTLVFKIKGVNWPYVFFYNNYQRMISKINSKWGDPFAGATRKVAWGYGQQALQYSPTDKMTRFRGPNLAHQKDGTVLVNALLLFGVDSLEPESKIQGIARGKKEIPHILKFMRERFPGFSHAEFVDVAERLYVRETRHIKGEYRLTITDVLENKDHWDRIAHGSYPVDIQPTAPDNLGNVIGKPDMYSIPFRCLVPLKVENLLVVGRSASYDSLPHGSVRVIPLGMATGEAAGVASSYSIQNEVSFRNIAYDREAISQIQEQLKKQGAYLVEYTPRKTELMKHWAYPGLKIMRELGLAGGGYSNNYNLDKSIQYWDANYVINQMLKRGNYINNKLDDNSENSDDLLGVLFAEDINRGNFISQVVEILTDKDYSPSDAREYLVKKGLLTGELAVQYLELEGVPTFGELYSFSAMIYNEKFFSKGDLI